MYYYFEMTEFDYKLVFCTQFAITYYVTAYKTIHIYYLLDHTRR